MVLYLTRKGLTHTDYTRQHTEDPLNGEFNSMPVLRVSLIMPKNTLTPILDERVL